MHYSISTSTPCMGSPRHAGALFLNIETPLLASGLFCRFGRKSQLSHLSAASLRPCPSPSAHAHPTPSQDLGGRALCSRRASPLQQGRSGAPPFRSRWQQRSQNPGPGPRVSATTELHAAGGAGGAAAPRRPHVEGLRQEEPQPGSTGGTSTTREVTLYWKRSLHWFYFYAYEFWTLLNKMSVNASCSRISISMARGIINPMPPVRILESLHQYTAPKEKLGFECSRSAPACRGGDPKWALNSFPTSTLWPPQSLPGPGGQLSAFLPICQWPQENQSAGHLGTPLSIILSTICSKRDGQYQVLRSQLPRNHAAQGPGYQWDLLVLWPLGQQPITPSHSLQTSALQCQLGQNSPKNPVNCKYHT